MTTATYTAAEAEAALALKSFPDFLSHVYVLDPPPGKGTLKFEPWPHLLDLALLLVSFRLLVVLKARQLGVSWLLAAYAVWTALRQGGATIIMLSIDEDRAKQLLEKARFVYTNLPDYLRTTVVTDNKTELSFLVRDKDGKALVSKIIALPATEDAGRSETATLVVQDEADFHEYLAANYAAIKPTIDAGAQLIQVSTSNKRKMVSLFKTLYRQAATKAIGENGFCRVFYGWNVRPGRNQEWYERQKAEYSALQEAKGGNPFEGEYPSTEQEALAPASSIAAFNLAMLEAMKEDVRRPLEVITVGMFHKANIWTRYQVGHRYAAFTDTSEGVGRDDAVTVVGDFDGSRVKIVADIQTNVAEPEQMAVASVDLLKLYRDPIWGIEENKRGIMTIKKAQELKYPHLYFRDVDEAAKHKRAPSKPGWLTGETNRWLLFGELADLIRAGGFGVPSERGLEQFFGVIKNPEKNGRIEGMEGSKDDYPFACGGLYQMKPYLFSTGQMVGTRPIRRPPAW